MDIPGWATIAAMPRFHCPLPSPELAPGAELDLPAGAARHVQVLRLQPGAGITLFNGDGHEYEAVVTRMGRSDVAVRIAGHTAVDREIAQAVHLAVGVPANDRMDWLVEKATELGVASIWPLMTERSVLRLKGERAEKKQAHWQAIAVAACEQCGRNRVPLIHAPLELPRLAEAVRTHAPQAARHVLSLAEGSRPWRASGTAGAPGHGIVLVNGPEGGLAPAEEALLLSQGFEPVSLGARVLRAETAPLTVLAALGLRELG
ncbi:MAG: Ribosomal RNA small subunit methyltransferase E [Paracidovorax wautersii]|uniref:Ribosomal RNA small subunit methyltransferase E n=1 Tax=Paracidovorax wautersii TaxID=1177982 RepID=A0A7V8FQL1_9BURK|nr:MAG: Ribosomal RNA small subunit methyltransferase E [Paracidovorax wautersii]